MTKPTYWRKAQQHLNESDPVLAEIIKRYRVNFMTSRGNAFVTLARSIVGQQISVKAADSVWRKFEAGMGEMTPQRLQKADENALRNFGLSRQKVLYLKGLGEHFHTYHRKTDWHTLPDDEVMNALVAIKGIGKWTAEMFLIFHLQRPDIFPIDDIGVQKAIQRHYTKGRTMDRKKMEKLAERWRPYRTVATWYLWRSLDPVPAEY